MCILISLCYQIFGEGGRKCGSQLEHLIRCLWPRIHSCSGDAWGWLTRGCCLQDPGTCWTRLTCTEGKGGSYMLGAKEVEWHWGVQDTSVTQINPCTSPIGLLVKDVKQWVPAKRATSLKSLGGLGERRKAFTDLVTWCHGFGQPQEVMQANFVVAFQASWVLADS